MSRENEDMMLQELADDARFQLYCQRLRSKIIATVQTMPPLITSDKEAAEYNRAQGVVIGVKLALDLIPALTRAHERKTNV